MYESRQTVLLPGPHSLAMSIRPLELSCFQVAAWATQVSTIALSEAASLLQVPIQLPGIGTILFASIWLLMMPMLVDVALVKFSAMRSVLDLLAGRPVDPLSQWVRLTPRMRNSLPFASYSLLPTTKNPVPVLPAGRCIVGMLIAPRAVDCGVATADGDTSAAWTLASGAVGAVDAEASIVALASTTALELLL